MPGAIEAISSLTTAFRENGISGMIEAAGGIVGSAIGEFTNALPQFVSAAVEIVKSLVNGIKDNLPQIAEGAVTTVETLADGIIDMLPDIIETGLKLIVALANSLITHLPQLIVKIPEIVRAIVRGFSQGMPNIIEIGKNIVKGVWQGIKSLAGWIKDNVKGFFGDIVTGAKNALGIHSPSTVFAGIGENMALGLGEGWDDKFSDVRNEINKSLDFDDPSMSINASVRKIGAEAAGVSGAGYGGTSIGNVTIKIDGAKYSNENSLAEAIAESLQNMTNRRAAVYA